MERKASTAALELHVTGNRASSGSAFRATRLAVENGNKGSRGTEEVMRVRIWSRFASQLVRKRKLRAGVLGALLLVLPIVSAAAPIVHKETRLRRVDRPAIENLQRWVNRGHDTWCRDAREVATAELRKTASEFSGNRLDLVTLPATGHKTPDQARFVWTSLDGHATYSITLRRYNWLKPLAGKTSNIVWVPSKIVIMRQEEPTPHKGNFAKLSKV